MAFDTTSYTDPGSYQQEVVVAGGASITQLPLAVGLVGFGSRSKRSVNEALIRGQVTDEAVTFSNGVPVKLAQRAVRRQSMATLYRNTVPLANTAWSFAAAKFTVTMAATADASTRKELTLSLDGKAPITIQFATSGQVGALAAVITEMANSTNGFVATITNTPGACVLATIKRAEVVAAINAVLAYATDAKLGTGKGYGLAYNAVAAETGTGLTLTSPRADAASEVAIYNTIIAANDAQTWFQQQDAVTVGTAHYAPTHLTIPGADVNASYTLDYVSPDSTADAFVQSNVESVVRVGNYAGVTNFAIDQDYKLSNDTLLWDNSAFTTASIKGVVGATFDVSVNGVLPISIDGKTTVNVDLDGSSHPGADPSNPAAATPTELALVINNALFYHKDYGALYKGVATVVGSALVLTSPTAGQGGIVELDPVAANSAVTALFGLTSDQLPYDVRGVGTKPAVGSTYFATYAYTRPNADYNVAKSFTSTDSLWNDVGVLAPDNQLAMGGYLAFKNGAPRVYVVQVNDLTAGLPTQLQIQAGIDAAGANAGITELVVFDSRSSTLSYVVNHIVTQNAPTVKHARRAWLGLNDADVGDRDTVGSYIYVASTTLQVPGDSPARGRLFLVAPGKADMTIMLENGAEQTVSVDGNFIAAAVAGRYTARSSVAQAMVGSQIVGFDGDTFPVYQTQDRHALASNGVLVIQNQDTKLIMLDPLSTEAAAGKLPQFEEPSASSQKDNIVANVNTQIEVNVRGVVPTDLADFIIAVKSVIGGVLRAAIEAGQIAPFRDANGRVRAINYQTDIQVFQMKSDARKYTFKYWFNLRYPAKRFFGEYSVDNPFFSGAQGGLTA